MIFFGDEWAEAHHDVHVMDEAGSRLTSRRLPEGPDGIRGFHDLIAGYADDPSGVVGGIETDRGLWVQALVVAGYRVYAINPVAVSRYRDRHNLAGAKSDAGDAKVLADLVRTDRHNHRPVAGDSTLVEAVKALAAGPSTTNTETKVTSTTKPSAPSATDSSGSSTAASNTVLSTTNTSPGRTAKQPHKQPLDEIDPWGI